MGEINWEWVEQKFNEKGPEFKSLLKRAGWSGTIRMDSSTSNRAFVLIITNLLFDLNTCPIYMNKTHILSSSKQAI